MVRERKKRFILCKMPALNIQDLCVPLALKAGVGGKDSGAAPCQPCFPSGLGGSGCPGLLC